MNNAVLYLTLLIFSSVLYVNGQLKYTPTKRSKHEICVSNYIEQVFTENYPIYYISDGNDPFMVPSLKDSNKQQVIVNLNQSIRGISNYPKYYVIMAKNEESLSKVLLRLNSTQIWNIGSSTNANFLLVFLLTEPRRLINILWKLAISNVVFYFLNVSSRMFHYHPFHPNRRCGSVSTILPAFDCVTSRVIHQQSKAYTSCLINFKTPYHFHDVRSQNVITRFILKELEKYLKLQVDIIDPNNTNPRRGNIVLSIGNNENSVNDSKPIYTDSFGWLIFGNKIPSLMILQNTFENIVWITIGITFTVTFLLWLVMNKVATTKFDVLKTFTNVWSLTLLGCTPRISGLRSLKTLVLLYLWFVIILHTAFKTNLAKILTVDQYEDSINNVIDLANSELPLCVHQSLIEIHFSEDKTADNIYTKIKSKIIPIETWDNIWKNRNCAYLMYMQDIQILRDGDYKFNYFADNRLTPFKYSFKVLEGFNFKHILDNVIDIFVENGVSEHEISENNRKRILNKHTAEENKPKVLSLDHVVNSSLLFKPSNDSQVSICISHFIKRVFIKNYPIYYVSDGHEPIIIPAEKYNENQYVIVNMKKPILGTSNYPRYYIVHVENVKSLTKVLDQLTSTQVWNIDSSTSAIYLIIISTREFAEVHRVLWDQGLFNAAFYPYKHEKHIYEVNPFYRGNRCGKIINSAIAFTCDLLQYFFQKMFKNYDECLIDFITPYQLEDVRSQNVITRFILKEFQKHLKLKVRFIEYDNTAFLSANTVLFIGNNENSISDSKSMYIDSFGWVIFVNKVPSLVILQYAFDTKVWVMIGITFTLTSLLWLVINKVATKRFSAPKVFIDVLSLTLLGCIPRITDLQSFKTLVLFYLWFIIIIHTAFKTNLAKILTVDQYEHSIDNVDDLANSSLLLCVHQSLIEMHFFEDKPTDPVYTKIKDKITPIETWENIWENRTCAYLMFMQDIQIFKNRNYQFNYFIDNTLTTFKYSFIISEGYQFKYMLDKFINVFVENGISEHVISKNNRNNTHHSKQDINRNEPKVLTLNHVYGVFVFWAVGIAISIIVFGFELLSKKRSMA
ncbi:hypothetical protein FQA39_LY16104 [Lamprigera yunnana]|nr:hypothetical protein FQA39_LY16104 [Lamprigera yunnana]